MTDENSRYRCLFSFYGGKSKLAHLYPVPKYPLIIEPFAGGASYSLRHMNHRQVFLNELDPEVYDIWSYLLSTPLATILGNIPDMVAVGDRFEDRDGMHPGLLGLLRAEANHGTQGGRGVHRQVTKIGAACWPRLKRRIAYWHPLIKHWMLRQGTWEDLVITPATWFIDPPYNNPAGRRYRQSAIDYNRLGEWGRSLPGQVIVCENKGADWLPFTPLAARRGMRGSYQQRRAMEVIWTKEDK